jgi:tetratricopeptide (TPR) repeat protein
MTATGRTSERELDPDELAALEEQREFLLRSLRDLEAEHAAGDVDDHDFAELSDDYTARAAAVIRAIQSHHVRVAARRRDPNWTRRLLWVAAVAVLAIGLGVFVAHSSGTRNQGDTITGGTRQSVANELLTARQQFGSGDLVAAIKTYDKVLADDPTNVEALAYRGWMLRLGALGAQGQDQQLLRAQSLKYLQQATQAGPTDGTALVFLAVLYGDLGQPQQALDTLAQVPAGSIPDFMTDTVGTFKAEMQAQVTGGSTTTTRAP